MARAAGGDDSTRSKWNRKVRDGQAVRLLSGCFMDAARWREASPWERFRFLSIAAAMKYPTRPLTLGAAAVLHGLPLLHTPDHIVLGSVNGGRQLTVATLDPDVVVHHRMRKVPVGGVVRVADVAATSMAWTASSIVADLDGDLAIISALIVLEGALLRGVTKAELLGCAVEAGGRTRRERVEKWVDLAGDRSESPAESFMRAILLTMGLSDHLQQVNILDDRGRFVGRVDFLLVRYGIIIEVDGDVKYSGEFGDPYRELNRERVRSNHMSNLGYPIIRISWRQMQNGDAWRLIRDAVRAAKAVGSVARPARGTRIPAERVTYRTHDGQLKQRWSTNSRQGTL